MRTKKPHLTVPFFIPIPVPPDKPVIRGRDGAEVTTASGEVGPYEVDEDLVLECEVSGGQSLPSMSLPLPPTINQKNIWLASQSYLSHLVPLFQELE